MSEGVVFRAAQAADAEVVATLLRAAADELARRGQALWGSADHDAATVAGDVAAGLYHLGCDAAGVFGVFRLQREDRVFWPEIPDGQSLFLHKLAVHPQRQGDDLAQLLLRHACALTRAQGRRFLRLDCVSGRARLRDVYERFGFRHHSDKVVGSGRVFHRFEIDVTQPT